MAKIQQYAKNLGTSLIWTYGMYVVFLLGIYIILDIRKISTEQFFSGFNDFDVYMGCVIITHFLITLFFTYHYLRSKFKW